MHTALSTPPQLATRVVDAAMLAWIDCPYIREIFDAPRLRRISQSARLAPEVITPANFDSMQEHAARAEVLFGCWGFPHHLLEDPSKFSRLRVIFYSGGSIRDFGRPLMERGIRIVSARRANAVSVAQFCLGQVILSCKGYFRNTQLCRDRHRRRDIRPFLGPGLYGETVGLLGMGAIARELVTLLRPLDLKILVVDPYLSKEEAALLGVQPATLEEVFAQSYVISNHLPNHADLHGILNGRLFASMRRDATFLNTGRGAQVNEAELGEVARKREDLMFLLDVTCEEPPFPSSPLYDLPNVQLSSHIAGAMRDEVKRLGDFVIDEFERYVRGEPLRFAEKLEHLRLLA